MITQTVDPAFAAPTKFIGPVYSHHQPKRLAAGRLLLLTDVPAVMRDFATPHATPLHHLGLAQLAALHLPAGSMGPKIIACGRFTAATGRPSAIGALTDAAAVLTGTTITTITTESSVTAGRGLTAKQHLDADPPASSFR